MRQASLFQSGYVVCISSLLFFGGCSRKPDNQPPAASPKAPQTSVDQVLSQTPADAPPPAPAPLAPTAPAAQPEAPPTTATVQPSGIAGDTSSMSQVPAEAFVKLNYSLFNFKGKYQRLPRDWNELIATKFLDKMPPAPPGKRYVFDVSGNVLMK